MSSPQLEPDLTLDHYVIAYWVHDGRYRLQRQHLTSHREIDPVRTSYVPVVEYLHRDAAGQFIWKQGAERAESWSTVQCAAMDLVHKLNQDGVTG